MKPMLLLRAAAAVLTLGIAPAYAGDGDGYHATTPFTIIQAQQAHTPSPGPVVAVNPANVTGVRTYATHTDPAGTWLFPPAEDRGN